MTEVSTLGNPRRVLGPIPYESDKTTQFDVGGLRRVVGPCIAFHWVRLPSSIGAFESVDVSPDSLFPWHGSNFRERVLQAVFDRPTRFGLEGSTTLPKGNVMLNTLRFLWTRRLQTRAVLVVSLLFAMPAFSLTATFDDLGLSTVAAGEFLDPPTSGGQFTSGGITFLNDGSFSGFSASTTVDTTTPGFSNQFSNITGAGAGGSAGFGIAYSNSTILLPTPQTVVGAEFTNTTYAALSMLDGDTFAKQFGGPAGSDPDYFRLLVEGIDDLGSSTGTIELMLADYRFVDDSLDFVLDEWVFLDLSGLGIVSELRFDFESSDVGMFGINTPTYFGIDNLVTIPEPGHALLIGLGLMVLASRRSAGAA